MKDDLRSRARGPLAIALCAALLAAAAPGQSGVPPPELEAVRWFNTPELRFEDLRGKAILLEAFRTWSPACASNVPGLNTRHEKGAKKGLVVIGITDEEVDAVEEWTRRHGATYPIVALRGKELEGQVTLPERKKIPVRPGKPAPWLALAVEAMAQRQQEEASPEEPPAPEAT